MGYGDLIQVVFLSALVFFYLGFASRRFLVRKWQEIQWLFVSPRYLKSEGIWVPENSSKTVKSKS